MLLSEMFGEYKQGYQDLAKDQSTQKLTDMRKTRLTLSQINQLRKMNDQRSLEFKTKLEKVKVMYGQTAQPAM